MTILNAPTCPKHWQDVVELEANGSGDGNRTKQARKDIKAFDEVKRD